MANMGYNTPAIEHYTFILKSTFMRGALKHEYKHLLKHKYPAATNGEVGSQ